MCFDISCVKGGRGEGVDEFRGGLSEVVRNYGVGRWFVVLFLVLVCLVGIVFLVG